MRLLWRALSLPRPRLVLLLRAGLELARAQRLVRRCPFPRLAEGLGTVEPAGDLPTPPSIGAGGRRQALDIAWAIAQWAQRWPWPPTCLMQALAARRLADRAGLPSLLVFGVRGSQAADSPVPAGVGAHAWLCCGDLVLTGASEAALHRPIALYRSNPQVGEQGRS